MAAAAPRGPDYYNLTPPNIPPENSAPADVQPQAQAFPTCGPPAKSMATLIRGSPTQHNDVSQPVPGSQPIYPDPWAARHGWTATAGQQPQPAGGMNSQGVRSMPNSFSSQNQQHPAAGVGAGLTDSPLDEDKELGRVHASQTPNRPTQGGINSPSMHHQQAYRTGYGGGCASHPSNYDRNGFPYDPGHGMIHNPVRSGISWEPSYKDNKLLVQFDATIANYSDWAQNLVDHLARTNRGWVQLLSYIEKLETPVTFEFLNNTHVGGVNAWDIACHLETFLVAWLSKSLRSRRLALCGNRPGNGLEMWRQLYKEYKGTGELIDSSGRKLLQSFPKCKGMDSLASHLDSWSQLIDEYGQKLVMHCPEQVRTMLLEILPDGLEDELDHPLNAHIKTHEQIIEWCKARTTKSRQKALAAQRLRQAIPGRMQPLVAPDAPMSKSSGADVDAPPAWFKPFINMVGAFEQGNRGRPSARADSPRRSSPSPSQRPRSPSPSGFKPKGKFIFRGGCNHCGKRGHERKDCREFIALKAKNGGKTPEGYKGAREVAYEKWRDNQKSKAAKSTSNHVKALTSGDDTCDSDSDFSESELRIGARPRIASLNQHVKPMTSISEESPWSKVKHGTRWSDAQLGPKVVPKKNSPLGPVKLSSERDIDRLLQSHPTIAALPSDNKAKAELQNLAPKSKRYVYIMMDSGASINAARRDKHFPLAKLCASEGQKRGEFAQTASGQKLFNKGKFRVEGNVDGHDVSLGFVNMDVDIPVVSVRQFIGTGHDVHFIEGGGYVEHRNSGAKIRFMELGGVYFLKMRMNDAWTSADGGTRLDLGFARPVP